MFETRTRALRIAFLIGLIWVCTAGLTWFMVSDIVQFVVPRKANISAVDVTDLAQIDLADARKILEKTPLWGIQRDGQPFKPKDVTATIEKKVVWQVVAIVVRPKERYLLIQEQGNNQITQVNEGQKLPDNSKLLKVAFSSYTFRMADGKKRVVDTNL